ncbi:MAG: cytochrome C oxidase subunit IV family protein [Opitutaceae bacterium]|nr:cytochrome C oxidase subunit IV family protein [Opitutaceae bacterium]
MSATTATHAPTADAGHGENKFHVFVQVAMLLAVITGLEIVVIYLPLPYYAVFVSLAFLSIAKFMFVIFIFMHLKWDKVFCTLLFFLGLVLAAGTSIALHALFSAGASKPVGSAYDTALASPNSTAVGTLV